MLREFPEILVNETCGFHVHHGVDPEKFGNRELFQLLRIVAIFENYIYHLVPEDRRTADTCRPLEIDLYERFRRDGSKREAPLVKNLWYSPENRDDAKTPKQRRLHPTRYHGLNLHSYWYRGTVEFRYFPSVLEQRGTDAVDYLYPVPGGMGRRVAAGTGLCRQAQQVVKYALQDLPGGRHDGPHPISRGLEEPG